MKSPQENNSLEQKLRVVESSANTAEPLVLMDCGDLSLFISSKDIVTLMSAQKIIASDIPHACGAIELEQVVVPVFALNKTLQLQPQPPSEHMTLVILQYDSRLFALCCFGLEKLELAELKIYPVPISMSSRKQPFAQFAVVNKRAAGLSSAAEVWRLLSMRNAVQAIPAVKNQVFVQGAG